MRLLRWNNHHELSLTQDLNDKEIPPYAILSHTWGADSDEVSFVDLQKGRGQDKVGYAKIQFCGNQAKRDGIVYFWVDTCCIDKTNQVELSEAITSMFRWYQDAQKCYVYLSDVQTDGPGAVSDGQSSWQAKFRASRWFTRGWTLQELLAPRLVEFFSREEYLLGTKKALSEVISKITTIPLDVLQGTPLSHYPITECLRWTEGRTTKKVEDKAYCLLGMFDIFMPLIYGEGDNAFRRLQKEITERYGASAFPAPGESHQARSLGLCLKSAPLIKPEDFLGRADEIDVIHDALQADKARKEQKRVVLGGVGGLGKTQLAIAYARQHQLIYKSVLWLNATSESTLFASLRAVAQAFNTAEELLGLNNEQVLAHIHEWLSQPDNTQWLLIFDNYDNPDDFDIEHFCPSVGHGSVVITTRLPDLITGHQVRVQPLQDVDSSLAILQTRSGRRKVREDKDARRLAQRLGGLPLALVTAGSFLRKSTLTFQQYLDAYDRTWQVDTRRPLRLQDYQGRTLYTTWNLSYVRLQAEDPDAAQMLQLLAYFDNQEVWYGLFEACLDRIPLRVRTCVGTRIDFESVMSTLVDYCMVEISHATRSYSMHNYIHDWTLGELNREIDPQLYWFAFDCVAAHINRDDWLLLGQVRYARISRHGLRLTHHRFGTCGSSDSDLTERLDQAQWIARMLQEQEQHKAAECMCKRILVACDVADGPDHGLTVFTLNRLSRLYIDDNRLDEAEQMCLHSLNRSEETRGPDDETTIDAFQNLGDLYRVQGRLEEAEYMCSRALIGCEALLGPEHAKSLGTRCSLGVIYASQGKLRAAEEICLQTLSGLERLAGLNHIASVHAWYDLGTMYRFMKRSAEGEQAYLRALTGYEAAFGPKHPSTLRAASNLGGIYQECGKLEQAQAMLSRVLETYQGSDIKVRWQGAVKGLTMVLMKRVRVNINDTQRATHQLALLIEHIDRWITPESSLYNLARALFWINDNQNAQVAFYKAKAFCDGCDVEITFAVGPYFCRQCFDNDLCVNCMVRYTDKSLTLPDCQEHEYCDVTSMLSETLKTNKAQLQVDISTWFDQLKRQYLSGEVI